MKEGLAIMGVDTDDHSPHKDRQTLQEIGLYFRDKDPNWWVNLCVRNVNKEFTDFEHNLGGAEVVIVDDLRFKNEYKALSDIAIPDEVLVYLVHIEVSEKTQAERGAAMDRLDHASETDLDEYGPRLWDLWIPEESSVEQRCIWIEQMIHSGSMSRST